MNRDVIAARLVSWLESERVCYLAACTSAGMPPTWVLPRMLALVKSDHELSLQPVIEQGSLLRDVQQAALLRRSMESHVMPDELGQACASDLCEAFGERCNMHSFPRGCDFSAEPERWVLLNLMQPMRTSYLEDLDSLDERDEGLARKCVEDLLSRIESEWLYHVTRLPVGGIDFEADAVEVQPGVRFERLSARELGDLFQPRTPTLRHDGILSRGYEPTCERWCLVVEEPCPKLQQPMATGLANRVILALGILGFELCGLGFARTSDRPGVTGSRGGQNFRLRRSGTTRLCTASDLAEAAALTQAMTDADIGEQHDRRGVTLHRFLLASIEESPSDSLLDLVIALEALLLPDGGVEKRYRFALNGARFLEPNSEEKRTAVFNLLRDGYDARSTIVHGGPFDRVRIMEANAHAVGAARRLIKKALLSGWPTKADFDRLCLA